MIIENFAAIPRLFHQIVRNCKDLKGCLAISLSFIHNAGRQLILLLCSPNLRANTIIWCFIFFHLSHLAKVGAKDKGET